MNRKLVVFVPPEALDAVRDALFAGGAGRIRGYERCSRDPAVGRSGAEVRAVAPPVLDVYELVS